MLKVTRYAGPLARLVLFAAGFAVLATAAEAVPSISPSGAARMERENAEAREQALKPGAAQVAPRKECMRGNTRTAQC